MPKKTLFASLFVAALVAAAPAAQAQSPYKPEYRLSTNVNNAFPLGRGTRTGRYLAGATARE